MNRGRFWSVDADGYILNDARPEYLQPPFAEMVEAAVAAYLRHIADTVHSIYVTGSVARGRAVPGESDLNMVALLTSETDPLLLLEDWIGPAEEALLDRFPQISDIQLETWPDGYVFTDPTEFSIGAFILKTHSVCVYGADVAPELPDYRISAAIANDDIVQIAADLDDALAAIEADSSVEAVHYWCRRAMKQVLWTGFSLVMLDETKHTRDVDLCAEVFARHYPAHAAAIQQAFDRVTQPLDDAAALRAELAAIQGWLLPLADQWLDTHNPQRDAALSVDDVEEAE